MNEILVADIMQDFRCIGSLCEDTCCKGWNISIDRLTYEKYRDAAGVDKVNLLENIELAEEKNRTEYSYAKIKVDSKVRCSFLSEECLCKVYMDYGENYLSTICNTFPRMVNVVNGMFEVGWNMSCPEVVRKMIGNKESRLVTVEGEQLLKGVFSTSKVYDSKNINEVWQVLFLEIRELSYKIVGYKSADIVERLLFLGIFISNIQDAVNKKNEEEVKEIIAEMNIMVETGKIVNVSNGLKRNVETQFLILDAICQMRGQGDSIYKSEYAKLLEGIEYSTQKSLAENSDMLQRKYITVCRKFFKEYEYFFENYIKNYILEYLFPFTNGENIFEEYTKLIVMVSLLRYHIILIAGTDKKIDETTVMRAVAMVAKNIEHDKPFLDVVGKFLKEKELANLVYLFCLMKN